MRIVHEFKGDYLWSLAWVDKKCFFVDQAKTALPVKAVTTLPFSLTANLSTLAVRLALKDSKFEVIYLLMMIDTDRFSELTPEMTKKRQFT